MANVPICSVPDCGKIHKAHGFCVKHYKRFQLHGDPTHCQRATPIQDYINEVVIAFDGNECLAWPFSRNTQGYGTCYSKGNTALASRVICGLVNGPPPTPRHQAAHNCGKGHDGCVNPRHLRWATRTENMADTVIHGTRAWGERAPHAKLTQGDIAAIRGLASKMSQRMIGKLFGVSQGSVSLILARKTWRFGT